MERYILGLDIGTGSTKGVAVNFKGKVLASAQHKYPILQPEPGYSEQDPELIWKALVSCVQDITTQLNDAPQAVGLSSAMHSLILVDEQGKALNPMITWADTRSEKIAQKIRASADGEAIYKQTGTPIHPMTPLCKLVWLRENEETLFKKAARFISIKEYIWFKLFGQYQVDYSIASATGLFDIHHLKWNEQACKLAGITAERLSEPVNTNYIQNKLNGPVAKLLGLPTATTFVIGASDGCCANLGSYVTDSETAALTIGTSGAVRISGQKPVYNYEAMPFNYLLDEKTFVSGGAVNNGGIAVDWLLRKFLNQKELNEDSYKELFKAIDTIPAGSEGLLFLPYLYGERAPIWNAGSSGAYLNIQPQHGQSHFLRAGLEGICFALNDVLQMLEDASGKIEQINISGGFISSATWVQILADITGKKLMVLQVEDASTIGAIFLAMGAVLPHQSLPVADKPHIINPDPQKHQLYARTFPFFKKTYHDLKNSMQQLTSLI